MNTIYCATGRALRSNTAKPTAYTARCELVPRNENFLGATASVSWRPVTAAFLAQNGFLAPTIPRCFPTEPTFIWYIGDDGLWWLGEISARMTTTGVYMVRFLDDPGLTKLPLTAAHYATSTRAVRDVSCPQVHLTSTFARGIQRNVDEYRGAGVDS